jgi:hypothetical protein
MLSQMQPDGTERPVCFSSKTLDRAQQQYTTTERECLAVVWATEAHRTLVLGKPFVLETDHTALKYTPGKKSCRPRECMGKIDVSIFPCQKGVVRIAPHVTKPKEIGAKNIFEKLLFLKHLKIPCRSGDITS